MSVRGDDQKSSLVVVLGTVFCVIAILGIVAKTAPAQNLDLGPLTGTSSSQAATRNTSEGPRPRANADRQTTQSRSMTESDRVLVGALALQSTVRVSAKTCEGYLVGSGFIIENHVITNRHLVDGAIQAKIDIAETLVFAEVLSAGDLIDLAVMDGWQLSAPPLTLAARNPEIGAPVLLAGHARGGPIQLRTAVVHAFVDGEAYGISGNLMLLDSPTEPGFSGGPVLDEDGHVVAVLQGFDLVTELTLAVPIESLSAWLENVSLATSNTSPWQSEQLNSGECR